MIIHVSLLMSCLEHNISSRRRYTSIDVIVISIEYENENEFSRFRFNRHHVVKYIFLSLSFTSMCDDEQIDSNCFPQGLVKNHLIVKIESFSSAWISKKFASFDWKEKVRKRVHRWCWRTFSWVLVHYRSTCFQEKNIWRKQQMFVRRACNEAEGAHLTLPLYRSEVKFPIEH